MAITYFYDVTVFDYTPKPYIVSWLENQNYLASDMQNGTYAEKIKGYQKAIGWYKESETSVRFNYKVANDFGQIEERTEVLNVDSLYLQNKNAVSYLVSKQKGIDDVSKYNVIYKSYNAVINGELNLLSERILLEADGFDFSYDTNRSCNLTVRYKEYQYKEFHIRVRSADDEQLYTTDIYTTSVSKRGDTYTLYFDFPVVYEQLYNSLRWLMSFNEDFFTVSNQGQGVSVNFEYESETLSGLKVSFTDENELIKLDILCIANIEEDREYSVSYTYVKLEETDGNFQARTVTEDLGTMLYSRTMRYNFYNFMLYYGDIVTEAVTMDGVENFYVPMAVRIVYDTENATCDLVVIYDAYSIIRITNNVTDETTIVKANETSLFFDGTDFVNEDKIPDGYRVKEFRYGSGIRQTRNGYDDYTKYKFSLTVGIHDGVIVDIKIIYTDEWDLDVIYMKQWLNSPFAVKTTETKVIKVRDYANVYEINKEQLQEILNIQTLDLLGVQVDTIDISFDNVSKYTAKVNYSFKSVKQISSSGQAHELQVPLSSYRDWCSSFGEDWSILMLNNTKKKYFDFSNDVSPDNLYGFFTCAVFKEQVSDLNSLFAGEGSNGCFVEFQSREVKGSGIYRFFGNCLDSILFSPIGYVGMSFCELINDDNGIYYSYFFYLDNTTDLAYIGRNNPDDYDDTDTAVKNVYDDVKESFADFFKENPVGKVIKWVLLGLLALIVLGLVIVIIAKIVRAVKG